MDRAAIDGFLHAVGRTAASIGKFNRVFDVYVINGAGDLTAEVTKQLGQKSRLIQTGRIQDYMLFGLTSILLFGVILYIFTR